jgi:hypothetical protein
MRELGSAIGAGLVLILVLMFVYALMNQGH